MQLCVYRLMQTKDEEPEPAERGLMRGWHKRVAMGILPTRWRAVAVLCFIFLLSVAGRGTALAQWHGAVCVVRMVVFAQPQGLQAD